MSKTVKSEQSLAVTSAKRVAVFQTSLKIEREEAGLQFCNKENEWTTSQESNFLCEWGCCK